MHNILQIFLMIFFMHETANALLVRLSDLHSMAQKSDIVIHGYVGNQHLEKDSLGRPITISEVEVIDNLYGAKNKQVIRIYQVGGEQDGLVMPILGGHHYKLFQELIFFGLKLDHDYVSYGAGQGKLDIIPENRSVREDLGDARLIDPHNRLGEALIPTPLIFPELKMLKEEIRLMLKDRKQ